MSVTQMEIPPVSIIIPAYNYARFLPQAIDSALGQTGCSTVEVLVVDDGSTDNTPRVLEAYAGRIRVEWQANAGLSAARNLGLRAALHPWIAFLDADDIFEPHALARMAGTLSQSGPEYGLVACRDLPVDAGGHPIPSLPPVRLADRDVTARDLVVMNHFPPSVLARGEVLRDAGGFDTALTSSEDRDLWIRCASRAKIRLLGEPLVRKRRHGSNMSSNADRQSRNIRQVLRKARRTGVVPPADAFFWARAWGVYHFQAGLMQEGAGKWPRALAHLAASAALRPILAERQALRQRRGCRLRAAARCLRSMLGGGGGQTPA
jgi:glycosyltransferase involved in cell wall biosynthesis